MSLSWQTVHWYSHGKHHRWRMSCWKLMRWIRLYWAEDWLAKSAKAHQGFSKCQGTKQGQHYSTFFSNAVGQRLHSIHVIRAGSDKALIVVLLLWSSGDSVTVVVIIAPAINSAIWRPDPHRRELWLWALDTTAVKSLSLTSRQDEHCLLLFARRGYIIIDCVDLSRIMIWIRMSSLLLFSIIVYIWQNFGGLRKWSLFDGKRGMAGCSFLLRFRRLLHHWNWGIFHGVVGGAAVREIAPFLAGSFENFNPYSVGRQLPKRDAGVTQDVCVNPIGDREDWAHIRGKDAVMLLLSLDNGKSSPS